MTGIKKAIAALRWLYFSERVLTISELAEAAVFSAFVQAPSKASPFEVSFDITGRIEDPFGVLVILSGLVITRENEQILDQNCESNSPHSTARKFDVLLAHFSVREWLVSGRLRTQVQSFATDECRAHQQLATDCIFHGLFSKPSLEYPPPGQGNMLNYDGQFKLRYDELLLYVANSWLKHTQKVRYESDLDGLITSLFSAGLAVQRCLFFRLCHGEDQQSRHALTPLYIMSRLGLYQPMKELLASGVRMSTREGSHRSALQVASLFGFESIAQLLLDHGADVNIKGGQDGTALQAASSFADEIVVQVLLDHGADVNIKGWSMG